MIVTDEVTKVLDDQCNIKGVTVAQDVASISEARFRIKDGQPTVEIPLASKFSDIYHQATSVVHACSHSQLYSASAGRVAAATEAGHTDQAAQDRVAAYKAPLKTEGRPHVAVERRGAGAPRALGCRTGHRTDLA